MQYTEEQLAEMEAERIKSLKLLEASYEMYENSKVDVKRKLRKKLNKDGTPKYTQSDIDKQLKLIQGMQDDVERDYLSKGGTKEKLEEIKKKPRVSPDRKTDIQIYENDVFKNLPEWIRKDYERRAREKKNTTQPQKERVVEEHAAAPVEQTPVKDKPIPITAKTKNDEPIKVDNTKETSWISQDLGNTAFDVIPLPSKGQCYPSKIARVPVAYLTAYDENILVSPNLYRDNLVLDYIVKNKIMNNAIDPDELVTGDRDAIILWLRATGYGNEFPITATDNETKKDFETIVDLSQIKFKEFNLVGDENGWFDYTTPVTKDKLKFRFLRASDIRLLNNLEESEEKNASYSRLKEVPNDLEKILNENSDFDREEKLKLFDAQDAINDLVNKLQSLGSVDAPYTNTITNRMEIMIMSVNGNEDRNFIHEYVNKMNVRDASSFRKYVTENEPGLDYNITIERPAALGGGSITLFLQLDQYLFLNIAE